MSQRIILHIDMDAFFASIEQAAYPFLKGKPLIVGSRGNKYRTVVASCSYEAKAYGVCSGMPTQQAFRLCPEAEFVSADSAKYLLCSEQIFDLLKNFSKKIQQASIDEFYLDVSFLKLDEAVLLAKQIKRQIREKFSLCASIGIAPGKIFAKIAAKLSKPDGLLCVSHQELEDFIHNLPVDRIPGIGPKLTKRLNLLSITTGADLAQVGLEFLIQHFGKIGIWLWQISQGIDEEEVDYWDAPDKPPKSIGHSYTLENPLRSNTHVFQWLLLLSEMVGHRMRQHKLESSTCCLWLSNYEEDILRQKNFHVPTNDTAVLYQRARYIYQMLSPRPLCIRALGIVAKGFLPETVEPLLPVDQRQRRLLAAIDRVNTRFGEWTLYPAFLLGISTTASGRASDSQFFTY
ncbi:MAG: DNA polymerase IV [Candidatus Omnitrophica bacterium]|nr:DNA polymerase IV [Candidatus Omnitrophota bacterium]